MAAKGVAALLPQGAGQTDGGRGPLPEERIRRVPPGSEGRGDEVLRPRRPERRARAVRRRRGQRGPNRDGQIRLGGGSRRAADSRWRTRAAQDVDHGERDDEPREIPLRGGGVSGYAGGRHGLAGDRLREESRRGRQGVQLASRPTCRERTCRVGPTAARAECRREGFADGAAGVRHDPARRERGAAGRAARGVRRGERRHRARNPRGDPAHRLRHHEARSPGQAPRRRGRGHRDPQGDQLADPLQRRRRRPHGDAGGAFQDAGRTREGHPHAPALRRLLVRGPMDSDEREQPPRRRREARRRHRTGAARGDGRRDVRRGLPQGAGRRPGEGELRPPRRRTQRRIPRRNRRRRGRCVRRADRGHPRTGQEDRPAEVRQGRQPDPGSGIQPREHAPLRGWEKDAYRRGSHSLRRPRGRGLARPPRRGLRDARCRPARNGVRLAAAVRLRRQGEQGLPEYFRTVLAEQGADLSSEMLSIAILSARERAETLGTPPSLRAAWDEQYLQNNRYNPQ